MASYNCPKIKTRPPGPKSRKLIARDERYVSQSYTRAYPAVLSHAQGAYIWDVDGNCYIDFHSGIGVCSTGNCHPRVVEAIKHQADKSVHFASADFYHEPVGKLAEKLAKLSVHGGRQMYHHEMVGTNSRLHALQAAILRVKLPHLESWSESPRRNAALYNELLDGVEGVRIPRVLPGNRHVYNQ